MFGLYPRKGTIAPGSDADIVVYDPNGRTRISVDTHHMNMDHSAYEGYEIAGKVDTVISRGTVLVAMVSTSEPWVTGSTSRVDKASTPMSVENMKRIDHWIGGKRVLRHRAG
jgi:hypothetical protein